MNRTRVMLAACMCLTFAPLQAQTPTRAVLLQRSRTQVDAPSIVQSLVSALNTNLGAPDSLWTVAAFDLASALQSEGRSDQAAMWLRWAVRHGERWPMNRDDYPAPVVTAYDAALRDVRARRDPGDVSVRTDWTWGPRFDPAAAGTVAASVPGATSAVQISITGRSERSTNGTLNLAPGTHELVIAVDGYESARVTREVLPGITTVLEVQLLPLLTSDVQARVATKLVQITFTRGTDQVCGSGYLASPDGVVLTSLGLLQGASAVNVTLADGRTFRNVPIAQQDAARDLAALKLQPATEALPIAEAVAQRGYGWAVHYASCGTIAAARTSAASWNPRDLQPIQLTQALPQPTRGAPFIDRRGMLVGIVTGASTVLPAAATDDLVRRARVPIVVTQQQARGRFPWKWVGAGGAVAGVAVALLAGGGGGGEGGPQQQHTTGGITITFPN